MTFGKYFLLPAAVCAMACISACGSYFVMPEEGKKTTYDKVEADHNGVFMLRLEDNCKGIEYRNFVIERDPKAPFPFKIYVGLNSDTKADWRVDPQEFGGQQLICTVRRVLIPPEMLPKKLDRQALGAFCGARFVGNPNLAKLATNPTTFCKRPAVDYIVRILPASGEASLIHGIMLFDDVEPGVIIDISYSQIENGEYALKLREYGEQFLQMVKIKEH